MRSVSCALVANQESPKTMLKTSFGIQLDMPQVGSEFSWIMTSDTASQPEIKPETTEEKTEDKVDTEE